MRTTETANTTDTANTTVTVQFMPEWLQASHEAAGYESILNAGIYPFNGAEQVEVSLDEARELLEEYGPWARILGGRVED